MGQTFVIKTTTDLSSKVDLVLTTPLKLLGLPLRLVNTLVGLPGRGSSASGALGGLGTLVLLKGHELGILLLLAPPLLGSSLPVELFLSRLGGLLDLAIDSNLGVFAESIEGSDQLPS
jgi:hypothetical protein